MLEEGTYSTVDMFTEIRKSLDMMKETPLSKWERGGKEDSNNVVVASEKIAAYVVQQASLPCARTIAPIFGLDNK